MLDGSAAWTLISALVHCREDLAQLALFNITVDHNTKYYDFYDELMPWINDNWDTIAPGKVRATFPVACLGPQTGFQKSSVEGPVCWAEHNKVGTVLWSHVRGVVADPPHLAEPFSLIP